jgi:hypothetical protein
MRAGATQEVAPALHLGGVLLDYIHFLVVARSVFSHTEAARCRPCAGPLERRANYP